MIQSISLLSLVVVAAVYIADVISEERSKAYRHAMIRE